MGGGGSRSPWVSPRDTSFWTYKAHQVKLDGLGTWKEIQDTCVHWYSTVIYYIIITWIPISFDTISANRSINCINLNACCVLVVFRDRSFSFLNAFCSIINYYSIISSSILVAKINKEWDVKFKNILLAPLDVIVNSYLKNSMYLLLFLCLFLNV